MPDEPAMCSWCWNSADETTDRYSTCTQEQDPIALGPPNKMATEDEHKGPGFAGLSMETDRGIPSHVGKEKQLHSATGYNIVIDSEGNVYGTREPYNQEAVLQFHSRAAGEVQIKGKKSNMYLAMNDKGKVYVESDPESENTWFKEEYEDGWNYYIWLGNQKEWYLGIKKSGKMKRGLRTRRDQNAVKFVPRATEYDQEEKSEPSIYHIELVKLYKRRLENWREVLIHCNAFLTWGKPYYPGIIAGIVTVVFLLLWYFDPSVLTTISLFGIIACILDYVVPILSASVFDSSKWTGTQEKKYEDICHGFVDSYMKIKHMWESVRQIKETKPYLYFIGVLGALLFTAWIGNLINNLFLTYLIVLLTALLPGIKSHNVIQENISVVMGVIKGITGQSKKKK